ncbi:MAG: hypothetical protein GY938_27300, partial [Ketobacter sp.]|nr:hypothetical protein [Ketobacter sp.]
KRRKEHDLLLLAEEAKRAATQHSVNLGPRRAVDSVESDTDIEDVNSLSSENDPANVAPAPRSRRARGASLSAVNHSNAGSNGVFVSPDRGDTDIRALGGYNMQRDGPMSQDKVRPLVVDADMQATNSTVSEPAPGAPGADESVKDVSSSASPHGRHHRVVTDLSPPSVDTKYEFAPLLKEAPREPIPFPSAEAPEYVEENKKVDDDIAVLLENLCTSPEDSDKRFYQSISKDWSEQISKGRMRHHLLNDVIYCTIIKILTEKQSADLIYTLPRSFRRSLQRKDYSIRNGLLYFSGTIRRKKEKDRVIWRGVEGAQDKAEGYCVPPKLRETVL